MHWQNRVKFKLLLASIRLGLYNRTYISLVDFGLTSDDLDVLLQTIDESPQVKARIEVINLSSSTVAGPSANTLTYVVLKGFARLRTVILEKNKIDILVFEQTPNVETLKVAGNQLDRINGLADLQLLKLLDIYANKFKALDLSGKSHLITALLHSNPLVSLNIAGCPLTTKLIVTEKNLDAASKLALANYRAGLLDQGIAQNMDVRLHRAPFSVNERLTMAKLIVRFDKICQQNAAVLNAMLGASRLTFCDMLLTKQTKGIESALVLKFVFDGFALNVQTFLQQHFTSLMQPEGQASHANNQLIERFLQREFKYLLEAKLNKAKRLFFSPGLDAVLKARFAAKAESLATAKQKLETTLEEPKVKPGMFLSVYNMANTRFNQLVRQAPVKTTSFAPKI